MCNSDCITWGVKNIKECEVKGKSVIEVGSYDVNGSFRSIFTAFKPLKYVGIDIRCGASVDVVCKVEDLVSRFGKNSFDIVVSTCTLEHIYDWKSAMSNIKNVCKLSGLILLIVPSVWPVHNYPNDYWRYTKDDIIHIFSDCEILSLDEDVDEKQKLVYAKITKPELFVEVDIEGYELEKVNE